MMDSIRNNNNNGTIYSRDRAGTGGGDGGLLRSSSDPEKQTASTSDFFLQWGTRKRFRCMKIQVKNDKSGPVNRTTVRVDRRFLRADKDESNQPSNNNNGNGYFNLRQRPASPQPPPPQRVLSAMRGQSNGVTRGFASPDRGAHDKKVVGGNNHNNNNQRSSKNNDNNNHNNKSDVSSEMVHESKKGGSSSGSGEAAAPSFVWPPKFVIALTNKEREEDFMAIKGSKLPQRPKKRAKFIQRTLNLVSPGAWLCDLTLERYEVREKKKMTKKRPRGLKAMMGNTIMESDTE